MKICKKSNTVTHICQNFSLSIYVSERKNLFKNNFLSIYITTFRSIELSITTFRSIEASITTFRSIEFRKKLVRKTMSFSGNSNELLTLTSFSRNSNELFPLDRNHVESNSSFTTLFPGPCCPS